MADFFHTLNYASVNEDWRTEVRGLALRDETEVLCVTGAGDRPLDLLAHADCDVVAIDLDPAQTALLHLKVAAMRALPFPEYARFLGLHEAEPGWRRERLADLAPALPEDAAAFWEAQAHLVARGVLYQGRWERHFRHAARAARLVWGSRIDRLFAFTDLDAQRAFLDREWDRARWRLAWAAVAHPLTSRLLFGDPAFYAHVQVPVGTTVHRRMGRLLRRVLARESFMVSLSLRGVLSPDDLPPYLTSAGVAAIRPRLPRLRAVTGDLLAWLETGERYDGLSLSDVPSFLDATDFTRLVRAARGALRPGGRAVIRQFLTRYEVPADLDAGWVRHRELERDLALEDRAFAYELLVAEVPDAP